LNGLRWLGVAAVALGAACQAPTASAPAAGVGQGLDALGQQTAVGGAQDPFSSDGGGQADLTDAGEWTDADGAAGPEAGVDAVWAADSPLLDADTGGVTPSDGATGGPDATADAAPPSDATAKDGALTDAVLADAALADSGVQDAAAKDTVAKDADTADGTADTAAPPTQPFWVVAYYGAWMKGHLPPGQIDFSALTSVVNFSIFPEPDGSFDTTSNGITAAQTQALVQAAHKHGKQALLGVGGAGTRDGFVAWMKPNKRPDFVKLVVKHVVNGDYDGVDIDMEPVFDSDAGDFIAFAQDLRAGLDAVDPALLLTAAVGWREAVFGPVQKQFDRFGIMTYDISGAWPGWETWHNSPLSNGGLKFGSTKQPLPSCQTLVEEALAAKAPLAKLGIGIDFYAYVWKGATGPNQPIAGVTVKPNVPYFEMMDTLYDPAAVHWHAAAQAPYLSLGKGAQGQFVSYDDADSIAAKIAWAKQKGLGGVIVWELGGGFRPTKPVGKQDLLLQAVKAAASP